MQPTIRPAGDRFLLIDFGNELSLALNLRCIELARMLSDGHVAGVTEVVPSYSTVLVGHDPEVLSQQTLRAHCANLLEKLPPAEDIVLLSRRICVPVTYNDRWTQECYEDYCNRIRKIEKNLELVARVNGLKTAEEAIAKHSVAEWWVGHIGFIAGLPVMMSLDRRCQLAAPRYEVPRMWTPPGTVALGGPFTAIYPMVTPDGYQMLGRTPLPIFDSAARFSTWHKNCFFRIGDRVKFESISEEEFVALERDIANGSYEFQIGDEEQVSLGTLLQQQEERAC